LHSAFRKITKTTNGIYNLENDLMPFLQKEVKTPNFAIDENFSWIRDANSMIDEIFDENIKKPLKLLETFKQYEYILNVDKKALIKDLFKGEEKAHVNKLR